MYTSTVIKKKNHDYGNIKIALRKISINKNKEFNQPSHSLAFSIQHECNPILLYCFVRHPGRSNKLQYRPRGSCRYATAGPRERGETRQSAVKAKDRRDSTYARNTHIRTYAAVNDEHGTHIIQYRSLFFAYIFNFYKLQILNLLKLVFWLKKSHESLLNR